MGKIPLSKRSSGRLTMKLASSFVGLLFGNAAGSCCNHLTIDTRRHKGKIYNKSVTTVNGKPVYKENSGTGTSIWYDGSHWVQGMMDPSDYSMGLVKSLKADAKCPNGLGKWKQWWGTDWEQINDPIKCYEGNVRNHYSHRSILRLNTVVIIILLNTVVMGY